MSDCYYMATNDKHGIFAGFLFGKSKEKIKAKAIELGVKAFGFAIRQQTEYTLFIRGQGYTKKSFLEQ